MTDASLPVGGQDVEELVNRVERLIERIDRINKKIIEGLNGSLKLLPRSVGNKIQQGMDEYDNILRKILQKITEPLTWVGNPSKLTSFGGTWINSVGASAADVASLMDAHHMRVDNYWKGEAVDAYKITLAAQKEAFVSIKDSTAKIQSALFKVALAIIGFWLAIGAALISFVVELVTIAAEAFSVVGAPAVPPTAILAAGATAGLLSAGVSELIAFLGSAASDANSLRQDELLSTAFPNDRWPHATTNPSSWKTD